MRRFILTATALFSIIAAAAQGPRIYRTEFITYDKREDAVADKRSETANYTPFTPERIAIAGGEARFVQKITVDATMNDYNIFFHLENVGMAYTLFETLEGAGAVCLRNEHLRLERGGGSIVLAGVDDPNGPADMAEPDEFVASLREEEPDSFVLLLAHRAYWAERYPGLDVDLILCGHTHGGIVRLPFVGGLAASNMGLFPEYDAGLFELPSYTLFISRGLGNSVPLPRFLNTPEIVSISLKTA